MDKDLLRITLIVLGIALAVGVYFWTRIKNRHFDPRLRISEAQPDIDQPDGEASIIPSNDEVRDEFETESLGPATLDLDDEVVDDHRIDRPPIRPALATADEPTSKPFSAKQPDSPSTLPSLIQLAVVALQQDGFGGDKLTETFNEVGLIYDEMKIFHHYENGTEKIEFSVANMVEPGTFPENEIASFRSPGIAMFLQPQQVTNSTVSFDRMLSICRELAKQLNGIIWDAEKQPLTEHTIQAIRRSLR